MAHLLRYVNEILAVLKLDTSERVSERVQSHIVELRWGLPQIAVFVVHHVNDRCLELALLKIVWVDRALVCSLKNQPSLACAQQGVASQFRF